LIDVAVAFLVHVEPLRFDVTVVHLPSMVEVGEVEEGLHEDSVALRDHILPADLGLLGDISRLVYNLREQESLGGFHREVVMQLELMPVQYYDFS